MQAQGKIFLETETWDDVDRGISVISKVSKNAKTSLGCGLEMRRRMRVRDDSFSAEDFLCGLLICFCVCNGMVHFRGYFSVSDRSD